MGRLIACTFSKSAGKEMREKFKLDDPTLIVKEKLLASLCSALEIREIRTFDQLDASDTLESLKRNYGEKVEFDFKTV